MIEGYSVVAAELNRWFAWPDHRPISRQQVEAWHRRRTVNRLRQLPPSPVHEVSNPPRTSPRFLFDTRDWVEWARPGVPAVGGRSWIIPEPKEEP